MHIKWQHLRACYDCTIDTVSVRMNQFKTAVKLIQIPLRYVLNKELHSMRSIFLFFHFDAFSWIAWLDELNSFIVSIWKIKYPNHCWIHQSSAVARHFHQTHLHPSSTAILRDQYFTRTGDKNKQTNKRAKHERSDVECVKQPPLYTLRPTHT